MGNYNKQYENYYRKINNKSHGTSPKFERNLGYYDLDKSKGRGHLKEEKISKYLYKELITSSFLSGCIFFSFFGMKYVDNDFMNNLSAKFKEVISKDGYYKEMALKDSGIVSALSKSVERFEENKIDDSFDNEKYLDKDDDIISNKENKEENSLDRKDEINNKIKNEVESFSEFSVVKKTALDFLNESSVIVFDGKVKELDKDILDRFNIKGNYVYLSGIKGNVKSLMKGKIKSIKNEGEVFNVITEHEDGLNIIYYNLGAVNKNEGEEIKANEVLGESLEKEINGVLLQILLNEKYLNPKEHLKFLRNNTGEIK